MRRHYNSHFLDNKQDTRKQSHIEVGETVLNVTKRGKTVAQW